MRRFIPATFVVASLVVMFAVPQTAQASGQQHLPSVSGQQQPPSASSYLSIQSGSYLSIQPDSTLTKTYPNRYPWGQCTWWAAQNRLTENLENLGNAGAWATNARKRGLSVGATPRVGATAVFAPGVQGAGSLGHVAHVIAVSGKRFEVSEMNFYGGTPRGGFGKVDHRWATSGSGVSFIY